MLTHLSHRVRRYYSSVQFPILDSYPRILLRGAGGSPLRDAAPVRTALTADSSVTAKVRGLRAAVVRSIGLEDREAVGNELAEIAEGYREGWSSGSDDDDDDDG